jgi:hypothetical protein
MRQRPRPSRQDGCSTGMCSSGSLSQPLYGFNSHARRYSRVLSLDTLQAPSVRKLVKEVKQRLPCYLTLVIYDKSEEPPVRAPDSLLRPPRPCWRARDYGPAAGCFVGSRRVTWRAGGRGQDADQPDRAAQPAGAALSRALTRFSLTVGQEDVSQRRYVVKDCGVDDDGRTNDFGARRVTELSLRALRADSLNAGFDLTRRVAFAGVVTLDVTALDALQTLAHAHDL